MKVEDALKRILKDIRTLGLETVGLKDSLGRVLAEDIHSHNDIPGFDNSAMDGYAVRSQDTKGASKLNPRVLEVIADIKAGDTPTKSLKKNQAIRIMTGAMIPSGADSVVMVEDTEKISEGKVKIFKETKPLQNIRKAGEDIKKGERVLKGGMLLTPSHTGILASLGKSKVKVFRRPKVAILATGDELVDVDKKLPPGKIHSSNTYTLYSQALSCGAIPKNLGIAKDRPQELMRKIKQGLDCDMLLTSGGVSVGDYDFVKGVLAELGTEMKFWRVAMRPGKPLAFGMIKHKPVFGLPGNPVSSMVSFEIFVRPAILKMSGRINDDRKEVEAKIEEDIEKKRGLKYFLRANTYWANGIYLTRTTGPQGSGILKSMALANSLIILEEGIESVKKGTKVRVRFLSEAQTYRTK